ncbi:hypothetical protein DL96DRAFT_1593381 [Flagelloscypha sp. PMI_526]|nr:hypothetical protein DL96DRAFT_1593381 [Flagelloscypha sp. PMI_526]
MSWLKTSLTGEQPAPYVDTSEEPKVRDPSGLRDGRMVSNKKANQPFLKYAAYREERAAEHRRWEERKKAHEEKVAKGEASGKFTERDPTEEVEVNLGGALKFLVYALLIVLLAGKFFVGSWTWGTELENNKWLKVKTYFPDKERLFSEHMLAGFDGSVPGRPIYLAIDGEVYDVSEGSAYQPGGSYAHFAGVDGARAFATGCFKEHRTHDLRGLSEKDLKAIQHWKDFYANHKTYRKIGRVSHRPIDPSSPIPEDCKKKKPQQQQPQQPAGPHTKDKTEL